MKFLLPCPACGNKTPVATGQAGQVLQCTCGQSLDVPSIRELRKLTPVVDEHAPARAWGRRQGFMFLGCAIVAISAVAAGCILALRPAAVDRSALTTPIDTAAIAQEVAAYSPADGYRRFQMIENPLPSPISEQAKSGNVPLPWLPSMVLLVAFEGQGSQALAPDEAKKVMQALSKLALSARETEDTRSAAGDWLLVLAVTAVFGLGLAGFTLLIPDRQPHTKRGGVAAAASSRDAQAGTRR